jgi:uncharacterized membrane protein YphA (DoxX/SURF4 family)
MGRPVSVEAERDGWTWAILLVRWVLGLIFLMAGWWKVFELGPLEQSTRFMPHISDRRRQ